MVSFGASPALSSVVRLPNPSYNISSVGLRDMVQERPRLLESFHRKLQAELS